MPGIDGLETLKRIKTVNKDIPVIILTGHGDLDAAIKSIKLGAYDFMRKPIDDLNVLLIDIERTVKNYALVKRNTSLTRELQEINKDLENKVKERTEDLENALSELKIAQRKINEEIKTVSVVQQNLLPDKPPKREGLDAAGIYLASDAVGGDYYDYIDLGNDRIGIVMADVSGHGLPAAFVMTMVKVMLTHLAGQNTPLKKSIETLNNLLSTHIPTNNFVTMIYGILDLKGMTFSYINAGHEPLLHLKGGTKEFEVVPAKSTFLGIDNDTQFTENTINLEKGDKLIFYTDGITESTNTKNESFGYKQLTDVIKNNADSESMTLITDVISALSNHCHGMPYLDDITLMVLSLT